MVSAFQTVFQSLSSDLQACLCSFGLEAGLGCRPKKKGLPGARCLGSEKRSESRYHSQVPAGASFRSPEAADGSACRIVTASVLLFHVLISQQCWPSCMQVQSAVQTALDSLGLTNECMLEQGADPACCDSQP